MLDQTVHASDTSSRFLRRVYSTTIALRNAMGKNYDPFEKQIYSPTSSKGATLIVVLIILLIVIAVGF